METHAAICLKVVVRLDPLEEMEADPQDLHGERWATAAGSELMRREPHPRPVLQPQNHPEHSAVRGLVAAGKVCSPRIVCSLCGECGGGKGESMQVRRDTPCPPGTPAILFPGAPSGE